MDGPNRRTVESDRRVHPKGCSARRWARAILLASVSRLARTVLTPEQQKLILKLREMIAQFEDTRDLRLMGGYHSGADPGMPRAASGCWRRMLVSASVPATIPPG